MKRVWYKQPATCFEEAIPFGNGRFGGMHYAGAFSDKISLNEDTLWSGYPMDKSGKDPYKGVCEAKKYMGEGKVAEAEETLHKNTLGEWTEFYQPAGSFVINLKNQQEFSDYFRELDLNAAVLKSGFNTSGNKYTREVFCSGADNVMVYRFKTEADFSELEVLLESPHPYKISLQDGVYVMRSIAPTYSEIYSNKKAVPVTYDSFEENRALSYCVMIKPVLLNGKVTFENGILNISSTDFYLIIDAATNFAGYNVAPKDSNVDEFAVCLERIKRAANYSFDDLKNRHIEDYTSLFNRVDFGLDTKDYDYMPTDERLEKYFENESDNGLTVLLYDFARYLTISSSRGNSQPSNLQGIWNEKVKAPWASNYTLNINTEMNYWHVEKSNLSECHMPLLRHISRLAEMGKKTAKNYYNADGWCSHHNTDVWAQTDPVGGSDPGVLAITYGFWNMSGCWLANHIWEHFEYTKDTEFLKENYGILKGAVRFLLDWMVEDDNGHLNTPISISPENTYVLEDGSHAVSEGSAMDIGIAAELFDCFMKASNELHISDDFTARVNEAMGKLKPYSISENGYLLEWDKDYEQSDVHHRHLSHLFGLYPGHSISKKSPELMQAAKKVLEIRGDEGTGWSIGWRVCCWSRLGDGEKAKKVLDNMLRLTHETVGSAIGGGIYPNLFAAHPPFQIDANFAFAAGVNEMLLQIDDNGDAIPLPAIPDEWKKGGHIKGIKLPGGKTACLEWKNGEVTNFKII